MRKLLISKAFTLLEPGPLLAGFGVAEAGTDDARRVVPEMKRAPFQAPLFGGMAVRQDGRAVHAMHLFEVKKPAESKGAYDYYKLLATIPGDQAFRPLAESECPLVKK